MTMAITYTGEKGPAVVSVHGAPNADETEADFLTRMIPSVVPEPYRASAAVVTRAEADAAAANAPAPVPQSITMRQLLIGLMGAEWITPAQADAWSADGTLPATITAVIDALPTEAERVAARITARKMSNAYRNDPLLIAAAQAAMPDAETINATLDQAFREWSAL